MTNEEKAAALILALRNALDAAERERDEARGKLKDSYEEGLRDALDPLRLELVRDAANATGYAAGAEAMREAALSEAGKERAYWLELGDIGRAHGARQTANRIRALPIPEDAAAALAEVVAKAKREAFEEAEKTAMAVRHTEPWPPEEIDDYRNCLGRIEEPLVDGPTQDARAAAIRARSGEDRA
jgi:hypothetical protein